MTSSETASRRGRLRAAALQRLTPAERRVLAQVATLVQDHMRRQHLSMLALAERATIDVSTLRRCLQTGGEQGRSIKLNVLAHIADTLHCDVVLRLQERPRSRS